MSHPDIDSAPGDHPAGRGVQLLVGFLELPGNDVEGGALEDQFGPAVTIEVAGAIQVPG